MRLYTALCVALVVGAVAGSRKKHHEEERNDQFSEKILDDGALTLARGDELLASYLEGMKNKDSKRMKEALDKMSSMSIRSNITRNSELLEEALRKEEYKGYSKSSFARSLKLQLDILGVKYDEVVQRDVKGKKGSGVSFNLFREEKTNNDDGSSISEPDYVAV